MPTLFTSETDLKFSNAFGLVISHSEYFDCKVWCIENCSGKWEWLNGWRGVEGERLSATSPIYRQISFEDVEDAIAFKLRWM